MPTEIVELFSNVSFGAVILWTFGIGTLGALIYRGVEKYRKARNELDDKNDMISKHNEEIDSIKNEITDVKRSIDSLSDKMSVLADMLIEVEKENNKREQRRLRSEILKFGTKLRNGQRPPKEAFDEIFESNAEYKRLLSVTGLENGYTEREMDYINRFFDTYDEDIINHGRRSND